ncbi:MAG: NAD-dependent epimerase/dehydratase family protein [Acidobacteriota bacterium]
MNILVTGGAGFIGSHVAEAYLREGHRVVIVDDLSTGRESNVPSGASFERLDIRDPGLSDVFAVHGIDFVNHHAARADVRDAVRNPRLYLDVNVAGGMNLLECARAFGVKGFVFASSGGCSYGEPQYVPTDERHPLSPHDPYGASKVCFELYLQTYHSLHDIPYTIFRYPNVYGPRQYPFGEAAVAAIFSAKMLTKQPVTIFGDGTQVRDFVYIDDVVRANVLATGRSAAATYNLGWGRGVSVNDLFQCLKGITGYEGLPIYAGSRLGEISRSILGAELIRHELGWEPEVDLMEGMRRLVTHIRNHELQ